MKKAIATIQRQPTLKTKIKVSENIYYAERAINEELDTDRNIQKIQLTHNYTSLAIT